MATTPVTKETSEDIRITRACLTLQRAFLAYREATWARFCKEVVTPSGDGVTVCMVDDPTKTGRRNGWFCDFPDHLVPDFAFRYAVLTTMSSHEIGFLKKLIEQMFEGLNVKIEEVKCRIKMNGSRTVVIHEKSLASTARYSDLVSTVKDRSDFIGAVNDRTDFNLYDFWFMRVTPRCTGRPIALNIAGSQFGIQTVSPWETHNTTHVEKIIAVKPFGTLSGFTTEVAELKGLMGMQFDISASAMNAWHESVDPAMEKKGLSWAKILKKSPTDFERHRDKVLKVGKNAIDMWVANQKLTKRRLKAERYDERHGDELSEIMNELMATYLDVNVEMKLDRSLALPRVH